ncbi:DUF11 domain-containing protein [Solilutibacter tolerans]|nr:DUF11 domain-containing protein [Lysobacter tolerans]
MFRVSRDARPKFSLEFKMNSMRWVMIGLVLLCSPIAAAQTYVSASSYQGGTAGANGYAVFRYELVGGSTVDVTLQATGTTFSGGAYAYHMRVPNSSMANAGSLSPSSFYPGTQATSSIRAALLDTWGVGCGRPGTGAPVDGTTCGGRGTLTITFSMPVRDPILHFGGLGDTFPSPQGQAIVANTVYSLVSADNGGTPVAVTLDRMAGNAVFGTTASSALHSGNASSVNASCDTAPPQAACGSVRVNGTVSRIVLNVSLRGYSHTPPSSYDQDNSEVTAEGHTVGVSLAPTSDLVISKTNTPLVSPVDQTGDTVVSGAPITYVITVRNNGLNAASGSFLSDPVTANLNCSSAVCSASSGSVCPAQTGAALVAAMQTAPGAVIPALLPGGEIRVQLVCTPQ